MSALRRLCTEMETGEADLLYSYFDARTEKIAVPSGHPKDGLERVERALTAAD